jgi:hypothetical protein
MKTQEKSSMLASLGKKILFHHILDLLFILVDHPDENIRGSIRVSIHLGFTYTWKTK